MTSPPAMNVPESEVVAAVSFDTASLTNRLASEIPRRVAAARDVDAGMAGKLRYRIDRSPFSVAIRNQRLVVSTHLRARADLCKPLGPLGCVDYAYCSPQAHATAAIPLSLGRAYQLGPASVAIRVTRPCQVGGIDATPRIQRGAKQQARRIERRLRAMLPSFADDAQALWTAMGVHVPLGIDTRLCIAPNQVVEGTARRDEGVITIPLGVRGRVSIEPREGGRDDVGPIPPPTKEPDLQPGVRLHVPIGVDWEDIHAGLSRSVRHAKGRHHASEITSVRARPHAGGLILIVTLHGPTCGAVAFRASPVFHEASGRIALSRVAPLPAEIERTRAHDPSLDLHDFARQIERLARVELPVDPFAIPKGIERSVEIIGAEPHARVRVSTEPTTIDHVAATRTGIAVVSSVRGTARVVIR